MGNPSNPQPWGRCVHRWICGVGDSCLLGLLPPPFLSCSLFLPPSVLILLLPDHLSRIQDFSVWPVVVPSAPWNYFFISVLPKAIVPLDQSWGHRCLREPGRWWESWQIRIEMVWTGTKWSVYTPSGHWPPASFPTIRTWPWGCSTVGVGGVFFHEILDSWMFYMKSDVKMLTDTFIFAHTVSAKTQTCLWLISSLSPRHRPACSMNALTPRLMLIFTPVCSPRWHFQWRWPLLSFSLPSLSRSSKNSFLMNYKPGQTVPTTWAFLPSFVKERSRTEWPLKLLSPIKT